MVLVATQVKRRRGTGAENDAFAGAEGEITVDLTNKELRVHTGDNKAGGYGLARKDLQNLTDKAKNISNWSRNITNCITEIPQDIKLELNNGTLTLKAGSKVYVPNGVEQDGTTKKYETITIASDLTNTASSDTYTGSVYYDYTNGTLIHFTTSADTSGTTPPANRGNFYNSSTNYLNRYSSGVVVSQLSLPLAHITVINGVITDIQSVFNGFGYIGSSIFILPNVKGLIPNGRNTDGTLKNTSWNSNIVGIRTFTSGSGSYDLLIDGSGFTIDQCYYDNDNNFNTNANGIMNQTLIGTIRLTSGAISDFNVKTAFHALDYNDSEYIAHQAMPSDRYTNLTLGSSGTNYTAPADGWFFLNKAASAASQYISFNISTLQCVCYATAGGQNLLLYIPVSKGKSVGCWYSAGGTTGTFRFVYANGAK